MRKEKIVNSKQRIMAILALMGMISWYTPIINNSVRATEFDDNENTANLVNEAVEENNVPVENEEKDNIVENKIQNEIKSNDAKLDDDSKLNQEAEPLEEETEKDLQKENTIKEEITKLEEDVQHDEKVSAPKDKDGSEIIEFKNENFKKLLINSRKDLNNDNEISKAEMEQITELEIYGEYMEFIISNFDEIIYAENLTKLYVSNYASNNVMNISPIAQLSKLKYLKIAGNNFTNGSDYSLLKNLKELENLYIYYYTNNSSFDFSDIAECQKLKVVDVSTVNNKNINALNQLSQLEELKLGDYNNSELDISGLSGNSTIKKMTLNGTIKNASSLWNTKISKLLMQAGDRCEVDINGIEKLSTLNNLSLYGYKGLENVKNLESLKKIGKLNKLNISLPLSYDELQARILTRKIAEQRIVDTINGTNCDEVRLSGAIVIELDPIEVGDSRTINYEDLGPIMKSVLTKGDKLYNSNLALQEYEDWESDTGNYITFDNENKKLTIDTDSMGERRQTICTNIMPSNNDDNRQVGFSGSIKFMWNNIVTLGNKKKVNIPDENLKNALLANYDIDKDEEITTNDLTNVDSIILQNYNITDLTGLEEAVNITDIQLDNNNISDISPIAKIEKLNHYGLGHNNISDISPLNNKENLVYLDLSYNKMSDISKLAELKALTEPYHEIRDGKEYVYRRCSVSLSNNNIKDISVVNQLSAFNALYLEENEIEDISPLSNYDFDALWNNIDEETKSRSSYRNTISVFLNENYIDLSKPECEKAKELFNEHRSYLILRGQKSKYKKGDVSGEGDVTVSDCAKILAHIKGTKSLTDEEIKRADVTGEGNVTLADCAKILAYIKGTATLD